MTNNRRTVIQNNRFTVTTDEALVRRVLKIKILREAESVRVS